MAIRPSPDKIVPRWTIAVDYLASLNAVKHRPAEFRKSHSVAISVEVN